MAGLDPAIFVSASRLNTSRAVLPRPARIRDRGRDETKRRAATFGSQHRPGAALRRRDQAETLHCTAWLWQAPPAMRMPQ
jgi:hypothetical protein